MMHAIAGRIFEVFDRDGNGLVDFAGHHHHH
jgi:Ca2+-binding EF-hand superfamily protein